ncbi:MAG: SDR family NAD(P)-dependent oxidoreductase [Pseudomonadota bacterium]
MHVLLTGGNRGIGAEIVRQMSERGDHVISTSRDGSTGHRLDVSDGTALKQFAGAAGTIDLLVCNAGVFLDRGQELDGGFDADKWAHTFAVNVTAVFQTIQAHLPNLAESQSPKIAIIASQMGSSERASGGSYIYRASKAAAINLATNLSIDLEPRGVAVGVYHPGWVRTEMGGAGADIDAATSATGLIARFDALSLAHTGVFENYDGTPMPY